jgi:hypothetical protein
MLDALRGVWTEEPSGPINSRLANYCVEQSPNPSILDKLKSGNLLNGPRYRKATSIAVARRGKYLGVDIDILNVLTNASTREQPRGKFLGKHGGPLATVVSDSLPREAHTLTQ